MWADLCGSYHTAGNTQYDCWPLNASKVDNAVIDCEGKICCYIGKADCQAIARSINSRWQMVWTSRYLHEYSHYLIDRTVIIFMMLFVVASNSLVPE